MKARSNNEIIDAGILGLGSAALLLSAGGFVFAVLRDGWDVVFSLDLGGALAIALGLFLFVGFPGFVIGLLAIGCLLLVGARSPWFSLVGIGGAALIGAFMEFERRGVPDFMGGMLLALYAAAACAIIMASLRWRTRTA